MNGYRIPVPSVPFAPPVYVCPYNNRPFTLDGRIGKDFWAEIPYTEDFSDIEGSNRPAPRFRTRAKMCRDRENLYVAALLEGSEIWATLTEHDSVIFNDNDFEIFLDPDSDTQSYIEYEMNALNTYWDLLLTKAYRDMGRPIDGYEVRGVRRAVHIDGTLNRPDPQNRSWSAEAVFPFAALKECAAPKRPPLPGEYYRVNFSRVQWRVNAADGVYRKVMLPDQSRPLPEDNWVWAPTGVVNIHYPELWAFVFFAGEGEAAGDVPAAKRRIPADELVKWELRKLYYAEHACLDEAGCFTADLPRLIETLARVSPCPENGRVADLPYGLAVTPHSFEITAPAPDSSGVWAIFSDGRTEFFSR